MDLTELEAIARRWFPVRAGHTDLDLISLQPEGEDVHGVFRLIGWDDEDRTCVRDIKEQTLVFLSERHCDDDRLAAAIEGWAEALVTAVDQSDDPDRLELFFPDELWLVPDLLDLARPRTVGDFCAASLHSKSRLGRLMEPRRS